MHWFKEDCLHKFVKLAPTYERPCLFSSMFELIVMSVGVRVFIGLFDSMPNTSFAKQSATTCDELFTAGRLILHLLCALGFLSCVPEYTFKLHYQFFLLSVHLV